jgi:hypothetical protein
MAAAGGGALRRMSQGPPNSSTEVLNMNPLTRNLKINVRGAALNVPVRVFLADRG